VNGDARFGGAATKLTTYSDSNYSGIFNGASLGSNESIYMGDSKMFFFAAGSEQMRLTSTGLGIGTTSPSSLLEVVSSTFGLIKVSNSATVGINRGSSFRTTSTTNGGVSFGGDFNTIANNANAPYNSVDGVYLMSRTSNFPLIFTVNNSGTEIPAMHVTPTGNLGLGVVPSAWGSNWKALELSNGVYLTSLSSSTVPIMILGANAYFDNTNFIYKNSGNAASRYQQDSGVHYWYNAPSGTAGNAITFTQAMTLTAGGDLGIANTSPSYRVDIEGSSGSISTVRINNGYTGGSDGSQILLGNSANFTNAYFRLNGGGNSSQGGAGSLNIGLTESAAMTFLTANTERLRITSGGNVGIGTTNPGSKLSIVGLPTSATGLSAGDIWNDGGTLKIV
jgi:hypothetical protein